MHLKISYNNNLRRLKNWDCKKRDLGHTFDKAKNLYVDIFPNATNHLKRRHLRYASDQRNFVIRIPNVMI